MRQSLISVVTGGVTVGDLVRNASMHNGVDTAGRSVSAVGLEPKDSSRGDKELARGVYTLANDPMYDWLVAFLESMREHEPDLPIVVIPFDDRIERVARLRGKYCFAIMDDPHSRGKAQISRPPPDYHRVA